MSNDRKEQLLKLTPIAASIVAVISSAAALVWNAAGNAAQAEGRINAIEQLQADHEARLRTLEQLTSDAANDIRWIRKHLEQK